MSVTVDDPPDWVDREAVTVEANRSYLLLSSPGGDVERRLYLTGVRDDRAYAVDHGGNGEQVTLSDVRGLVASGRLVPADEFE